MRAAPYPLATHPGRVGLGVLWLAVAVAWLATNRVELDSAAAAPLRRVLEPVAHGAGIALAAAPNGDVWWITPESAVRFEAGDPARRRVELDAPGHLERFGLPLDPIAAAHLDAQGGLWLGGRGGEVLYHRDGTWGEVWTRFRGPEGPIAAIATRDESVYVAGDGLWRGSVSGGPLEPLEPFVGMRVDRLVAHADHGVAVAAGGRVWHRGSGGWRDVWQADPDDGAVSALAIAPDGELWIGTSNGLVRVDRLGGASRELTGNAVEVLDPGSHGAALAGTRGSGLFARYAGGWRRVDAAGDLGVLQVGSLAQAPFGALWLATRGALYRAGP